MGLRDKAVSRSEPSGGLWPSLWVLLVVGGTLAAISVPVVIIAGPFLSDSRFLRVYRVPYYAESAIEYQMEYAMHSSEYNDVIFLGSSSALAGVMPVLFEERTGLRAYNLATVGSVGPDGELDIFRAYLDHHPKPKMVMYAAFPPDIEQTSPVVPEFRERFIRAYGQELKKQEPPPPRNPVYYLEEGVRVIIGLARGGEEYFYNKSSGARLSHRGNGLAMARDRGFLEYPQMEDQQFDYIDQHTSFTVSQWHDRSFREMAEFTNDEGIDFVFWVLPVPTPKRPVNDVPLVEWAHQLQLDYPQVKVYGLPVVGFEHSLYAQSLHLNRSGAEAVTNDMAEEVLALLQGPERSSNGATQVP
jgi:hypothetical protein